jgi:hypothetical protein
MTDRRNVQIDDVGTKKTEVVLLNSFSVRRRLRRLHITRHDHG